MSTLLGEAEQRRDQDLVRRYQSGDDDAFAQLYAAHHARLVRYCQRQVRDPHLAEELAQETFLRALAALRRFEGGRSFYPWLTVIARRLVIDHQRRSARVQPRAEVDSGEVEAFEDELVARVERDHVRMALNRVRARHREVLQLRDEEGLSYAAIAERLDTSTSTVQSLLHRARLALRREYLALSEDPRLVLPALWEGLRRLRSREARAWALRAEWGAVAAPLAAAALSVASLLSPPPAPVGPPAGLDSPAIAKAPIGASPTATPVSAPAAPHEAQAPFAPPVATLAIGAGEVAAAREESEAMPASLEIGPAFAGIDPGTVVNDTVQAVLTSGGP